MSDLGTLVAMVAGFDTGRGLDARQFPFSFVASVQTELWDPGDDQPIEAATDPAAWFERLRARGVNSLRLLVPGVNVEGPLSDRMQFGTVNSTNAFVLADGPRQERWRALYGIGDRDRPDRRIWRVKLQGVRAPVGEPAIRTNLPTPTPIATARLVEALSAARRLAPRYQHDTGELDRAIEIATAPAEPPPAAAAYQGAWLPDGWHSPENRRLIRAAFAANVFRGMGSWNDIGASDPEYDTVSAALFVAMLDAIATGTNSAA